MIKGFCNTCSFKLIEARNLQSFIILHVLNDNQLLFNLTNNLSDKVVNKGVRERTSYKIFGKKWKYFRVTPNDQPYLWLPNVLNKKSLRLTTETIIHT